MFKINHTIQISITYSSTEWALIALAVKFGGLGLQNFCEVANIELLNSKKITRQLYENVITQNKDFQIGTEKIKTIKNKLKTRKWTSQRKQDH